MRPLTGLVLLAALARPAVGQVMLQAHAGLVDRRLSDQGGIERQQGLVVGGALGARVSRFQASVGLDGGRLRAKTGATPDTDYGCLTAEATIQPAPGIGFTAGVVVQAYGSPLGTQRWILPRVGLDLSLPFTGVPGRAYLSAFALLGPSGTGVVVPTGGAAVRAGAELGSRAAVVVEYRLERLGFASGLARDEQRGEMFAGLRFRP